jgi:hypothetical protein
VFLGSQSAEIKMGSNWISSDLYMNHFSLAVVLELLMLLVVSSVCVFFLTRRALLLICKQRLFSRAFRLQEISH